VSAFVHWLSFTFSREIDEDDEELAQSFFAATCLTSKLGAASKKTLAAYHATKGNRLTSTGSILLHLPQRANSMIIISGSDCALIKDWSRVREYINRLSNCRISRLDLAVDVPSGLTLNDIYDAHSADLFSIKGQSPSILPIGDFVNDNGFARTINIGKRENGKILRAYEIGRKYFLGNAQAIRLEIEFNGSTRNISFDAITSPLPFFCGAYPFLQSFSDGNIVTTDLRKKERCANYRTLIEHARYSYGPLVNLMREIELSDASIVDLISRPGYPKGFSEQYIETLKQTRPNHTQQTAGVESGVESGSKKAKPLSKIAYSILRMLHHENLSKSVLACKLNKPKPNRYFHELLQNMLLQGFVEYTIPSKPNSRLQQYRVSAKGISVCKETQRFT
jgi:hypothetical protein